MTDHVVSRETLYARFDSLAEGRTQGDARTAHDGLVNRLAATRLRSRGPSAST